MKHSYHAHHAPAGACGSFLLGLNGAPGGFVSGPVREGAQDVFVGYRYAGEPWTLLPFVSDATAQAAGGALAVLPHGRYGRMFGWANDRWMAQALVFLLVTPFATEAERLAGDGVQPLPAVLRLQAIHGLLDFDNTHMNVPVELVFAIGDGSREWRELGSGSGSGALKGVAATEGGFGFATAAADGVSVFDDDQSLATRAAGLLFRIPAGGKAVFPLALGWGGGVAPTLAAALSGFAEARLVAQRREDELRASGLGEDARRAVSLATRAYLATEVTASGISLPAMRARAGV